MVWVCRGESWKMCSLKKNMMLIIDLNQIELSLESCSLQTLKGHLFPSKISWHRYLSPQTPCLHSLKEELCRIWKDGTYGVFVPLCSSFQHCWHPTGNNRKKGFDQALGKGNIFIVLRWESGQNWKHISFVCSRLSYSEVGLHSASCIYHHVLCLISVLVFTRFQALYTEVDRIMAA